MISNQLFDIARAIVAALGAKAHLCFKGSAFFHQFGRQIPQLHELPVGEYQAKPGIINCYALLQCIQTDTDDFVEAQVHFILITNQRCTITHHLHRDFL